MHFIVLSIFNNKHTKQIGKLSAYFMVLCYLCFSSVVYGQESTKPIDTTSKKAAIDNFKKSQELKLNTLYHQLDSLDSLNLKGRMMNTWKAEKNERLTLFHSIYKEELAALTKPHKVSIYKINGVTANAKQHIGEQSGVYPSELPVNYQEADFLITADVLGIPLKAQGLFSNAQLLYYQPMNQFSISFDMAAFRNKIDRRLQEKMGKLKELGSVDEVKGLSQLNELQDLTDLSGEKLKEELAAYQDFDKLLHKNFEDDLAKELEGVTDPKRIEDITQKKQAEFQQKYKKELNDFTKSKKNQAEKKLHKQRKGIDKFLKYKDLTVQQLDSLIDIKDSLEKVDVKQLLALESTELIEKAKSGSRAELKKLHELGYISKAELLLSSIKTLEIGTAYPSYTSYTLNGIPVNGLNVEANTDRFYMVFTASKTKNASSLQNNEKRNLIAARLGWGQKENNHLIFNFMKAEGTDYSVFGDDITSYNPYLGTDFFNKRKKNYLVGASFSYKLLEWLKVQGEVDQSATAMNVEEQHIKVTDLFRSLGQETQGETFLQRGFASSIGLTASISASAQLIGKLERISPQYYSLGVPFLRTDVQGYELGLVKSLLNNQLSVTGSFGRWKDNLQGQKRGVTHLNTYNLHLDFKPQGGFYAGFDYQLNFLKGTIDNVVKVYNGTLNYAYKLNDLALQTAFTGTWSESLHESAENSQATNLLNPVIKQATLTQQVAFKNSLTMSAALSYVDEDDGKRINRNEWVEHGPFAYELHGRNRLIGGQWLNVTSAIAYNFYGVWENQLDVSYGFGNNYSTRESLSLASKVPIIDRFALTLVGQYNRVNTGDVTKDYKEWRGSVHLNYTF